MTTVDAAKVMPTVTEVLKHPAYPTAVWNLKPTRGGKCAVAEGRGGPFNIYWEIHGTGPVLVMFVIGLGGVKAAWQRQTLHFGHEHGDRYSMLVIENRGVGDSDKPLMRYSTSEMAKDALEVMQHVGWISSSNDASCAPAPAKASKSPRRIHLVGISMGGMIAQELATLIPGTLSTLTLLSTAAIVENTGTFAEHMASRVSMLMPKSVENSVRGTALRMFPASWLAEPDNAHVPSLDTPGVLPPTPREEQAPPRKAGLQSLYGHQLGEIVSGEVLAHKEDDAAPGEYRMFGTNYQRYVAQEMHKRLDPDRFGPKGFFLQLIAAGWHRKSPEQLADLADRIGRERISVLHGTEDGMISVPHGRKLIEYLKPAKGIIVEGMGHVVMIERWEWFNKFIEEVTANGEKLDERA